MLVSPTLCIHSVLIAKIESNSLSIPMLINKNESEIVKVLGLLDSGAGGEFIDRNYARNQGFKIKKLDQLLLARNVDGTKNKQGTTTTYVDLDVKINGRTLATRLMVTGLGKQKIILGFPWLNQHNPDINWKTGEFLWRNMKNGWSRPLKIKRNLHKLPKPSVTDEEDAEEVMN
jgi:aspartyl protease